MSSLDLGDQIVAEWVPMYGITYESKDDLLDVAFDRFNHFIRHPQDIVVEEDAAGIHSVAAVDREGEKQIVRLKEPLVLVQPPLLAGALLVATVFLLLRGPGEYAKSEVRSGKSEASREVTSSV